MDVAGLLARGEQVFAPGEAGAASAQPYALFERMGLSYGGSFQTLGAVWSIREADGRMQALGELRLPREVASTLDQYVLHPSLLDGALQSCVGLETDLTDKAGSDQHRAQLPFALDRLEVFATLPERCWVLVRGGNEAGGGIRKLDIEIADEAGRICARLSGFSSRMLRAELPTEDVIQTVLLRTQWAAQEEQEAALQAATPGAVGEHWIVLCDVGDEAAEQAIGAELPQAQRVRLQEAAKAGVDLEGEAALKAGPIDLATRYTSYAQRLLELVRQILASKPRQAVLVQLVVPSQGVGANVGGLLGLLKSAQQENPRLLWQLLAVEARP
jgi:hypothetical protein